MINGVRLPIYSTRDDQWYVYKVPQQEKINNISLAKMGQQLQMVLFLEHSPGQVFFIHDSEKMDVLKFTDVPDILKR